MMKVGCGSLLLLSLVITLACNEVKQQHFKDLAEAEQDGMIEKGWMPAFFPEDAKNILIEGDLDTSDVYGRFSSQSTSFVDGHCVRTEGPLLKPHRLLTWFPAILVDAPRVQDLEARGYLIYTCSKTNMFVAILHSEGKVFYWDERVRR